MRVLVRGLLCAISRVRSCARSCAPSLVRRLVRRLVRGQSTLKVACQKYELIGVQNADIFGHLSNEAEQPANHTDVLVLISRMLIFFPKASEQQPRACQKYQHFELRNANIFGRPRRAPLGRTVLRSRTHHSLKHNKIQKSCG